MGKLSKLLVVAGAIAGLLLVGIVWSRLPGKTPEADTAESVSEPASPATDETNGATSFSERAQRQASQTLSNEGLTGGESAATHLLTGWEEKVDEILGSTSPDADKAKQMIEMFPRLPADGQEEVVRHLTNLLPDQDYGLMRSFLTNAALPVNVLDFLIDDALNRPNSLKLPALLEVARNAQHPKAAEAKDFLGLFLEADYGSDWEKWQAGMEQWLKENPD